MRDHWGNCITHFDDGVTDFVEEYFVDEQRRCLLVAGAGFDPRSQAITSLLNAALGSRLKAVLIREERGQSDPTLLALADANERAIRSLVADVEVWTIPIFSEADNAPIGGTRIAERLRTMAHADDLTDIVLDISALSLGIFYPTARILLGRSEADPKLNFHVMVASDPSLDARIVGEPAARAQPVRGFNGPNFQQSDLRQAKIWLPQLAPMRREPLRRIKVAIEDVYKVCPILPFPASDPRRADALIQEYGEEIRGDWAVDARDFMYVSERNPLDSFRSIEMLKKRYDKTVEGVFQPQLILSPGGSKVMAIGALMAAIRYDLAVHYVEALRYDMVANLRQPEANKKMSFVHVWLDGPIYASFELAAPQERSAT